MLQRWPLSQLHLQGMFNLFNPLMLQWWLLSQLHHQGMLNLFLLTMLQWWPQGQLIPQGMFNKMNLLSQRCQSQLLEGYLPLILCSF